MDLDFFQGRKYRNPTLEVIPPQSDAGKLYKRDLMMSSSCLHGQSDTPGKIDLVYIQRHDFGNQGQGLKFLFFFGKRAE